MKKKLIISLIAVILVLGVAFAIGALVKENKDTLQDMIIRIESAIKEVLGDTIGFANREENLKLSKATAELMAHIFIQFVQLDKNLILESNFHRGELERLHKMAKEQGYEVLTLVFRGDVDILHQRYLNRMQNENRHPVHLSTTLDVYEEFKGYLEYSRKEEIPGNRLEVNADDFSYQTDEKLLKRIDDFINVK